MKKKNQVVLKNIPVLNQEKTGENIKNLAKQNELSAEQIRRVLGFTTTACIYEYVHGRKTPSIDSLLILSSLFHVQLDEILAVEYVPAYITE